MCGIVGYIGNNQAFPFLINSLKKQEYFGYDSAVVAQITPDDLEIERAASKIVTLKETFKAHPKQNTIGIDHTRWATHGAPTENNAHPHISFDGKIAVVRNSIIENYASLKATLQSYGIKFKSDTDTEVVAHLIAHFYKGDLKTAVIKALGNQSQRI